jgi:hypothetical protein
MYMWSRREKIEKEKKKIKRKRKKREEKRLPLSMKYSQ